MERVRRQRNVDERTGLLELLDFYRATLLMKCARLDHAQLNRGMPPTTMTLAGLLKHQALWEDVWMTVRFAGRPLPEPWASAPFEPGDEWEWRSAAEDSAEYLRDLYLVAAARTDAVIATAPLDALAAEPDSSGNPWNLRSGVLHLIEEAARHAGHADLIRESIDGAVGF